MARIVVLGAGLAGSAFCVPLADQGHEVNLVGTPVDRPVIDALAQGGFHPRLGVRLPPGLQVDSGALRPAVRFRRMATPENLLERYARPAPQGWARLKQEVGWGLAIGSLSSTAVWFLGQYTALIRYHTQRRR